MLGEVPHVFVYGTLLSDEGNNHLLSTSEKLGDAIVVGFTMHDLGYFPACVKTDNSENRVVGEVWMIDQPTLDRLDRLEGYPTFYDRVLIDTSWGAAWMYINNRAVNEERIVDGDWKKRDILDPDGDNK